MKRIIYICISVGLIISGLALPSFSAMTVDVTFSDMDLQNALGGDYASGGVAATQIYNEISKYSYIPKLARGFGNANTYSSQASTLRGYQGYDLFAVSVGSMVAIQAPSDDPRFYKDLADEIDQGDVYAGVGFNPVVIQAGLNLGFILDGLYVSFLFGKLDVNVDQGDYRIGQNSNIVGGYISYAIFSEKAILARSLLWRGVTLQTGYIHTDNKITFYNKLDKMSYSTTVMTYAVDYTVDPSVDFVVATRGNIVPVELYTSMRLLWSLNFGVGGGFDYIFSSKTDISLSSAGDVVVEPTSAAYVGETGKVSIDADTSGIKSDKYRKKLLANIGLSIGPVFIDFPMSYYLDNGYAIGLTAGFVW